MPEIAPCASSAPTSSSTPWTLGKTAQLTLAAGGIVAAGVLAFQARTVFMLLFAGIVLSTAFKPIITRLRALGATHTVSVCILYAVLVMALLGVVAFALPILVDQSQALLAAIPGNYEALRRDVMAWQIPAIPLLAARLPEVWPQEAVNSLMNGASHGAMATALGLGGAAARSLFYMMAILLLAFYWSMNEQRTTRASVMFLAPERRESARELIGAMEEKLGQYVRGQAAVCAIVGLMFLVSTWLIGVPYSIALACAATVFEAIPILGPALGAAPAILVAFSVSPNLGMAMSGAALVIHLIEANVLIPRVMEKAVGLSAVATMLAIVVFGALCGLMGAILAIPLAALVQLALERLLLDPEPAPDKARDWNAYLRRRAQELVQDVRKQLRNRTEAASDDTDRWEDEIEAIAAALEGRIQASTEVAAPPLTVSELAR